MSASRPHRRAGAVRLAALIAAVLAALIAACTPAPVRQPVAYDFGPLPAAAPAKPALAWPLRLSAVNAPLWMEANDMTYRLAYADAAQPRAYGSSRWVMAPPLLIASRLRAAIARRGQLVAVSDPVEAPVLRVDLEDFGQVFDSATASRGQISLRATLSRGRQLLAQKVFAVSVNAATADAAGGAHALAQGVDQVVDQVMDWLAAQPGS